MLEKEETSMDPQKTLEIIKRCSFDGIVVVDKEGTTIFVSDAYERIAGQKGDAILGKNAMELTQKGLLKNSVFERVHQTHRATTMVLNYTASGKDALVTGVPIFEPDGTYCAMMCNIRDLSELNELKRDLNQAHKRVKLMETELEELRGKAEVDRAFVAKSPAMRSLTAMAQRIAQVDSSVLITGESGVGKDVFAKLLRSLSKGGQEKPFVKISCGAIPENLLESELFGYMEGAFTGAKRGGKPGAFELAGNGIVFLDEIGEMPLSLQVKLLNVLQDRQFLPVGGTKTVPMNARIIAATNKDLEAAISDGTFRRDLYYRLNVIPVEIPPLRERREDIAPLIATVLQTLNQKYDTERSFSPEAIHCMERYVWPGNVRELVNTVERMMALCPDDIITEEQLPVAVRTGELLSHTLSIDANVDLRTTLERMERYRISQALDKPQTFAEAAKELGIDQSTLTRKIQKYKLPRRNVAKHIHEDMSNITF